MTRKRPPTNRKIEKTIDVEVVERIVADDEGTVVYLDSTGSIGIFPSRELPLTIAEPGAAKLSFADPGANLGLNEASMARWRANLEELPALVKEHGACLKRRSFWKGKRDAKFHDLAQHGRMILWRYGFDNGQNLRNRVVMCKDIATADWFLANFIKPKGFDENDGYVIAGLGSICRNYAKGDERILRSVSGSAWFEFCGIRERTFDSPALAEQAFNAWEHDYLAAEGMLFNIEIDKRAISVLTQEFTG